MAIQWDGRTDDKSFSAGLASVVIASALISTACSYAVLKLQAPATVKPNTGQITKLQSETAGLEVSLRNQIAQTAALRRELTVLTSDNGIIARLVGHIKTLREQNQMLSEIVTRSGNSAADKGERFPANGLAASGIDGAAMTEQNVASPTRLMVVTPLQKKEAGPQPAPAKETRTEPSDKPEAKHGTR